MLPICNAVFFTSDKDRIQYIQIQIMSQFKNPINAIVLLRIKSLFSLYTKFEVVNSLGVLNAVF